MKVLSYCRINSKWIKNRGQAKATATVKLLVKM